MIFTRASSHLVTLAFSPVAAEIAFLPRTPFGWTERATKKKGKDNEDAIMTGKGNHTLFYYLVKSNRNSQVWRLFVRGLC